MKRLNQDRQKELEPKRMEFAQHTIEALGFTIISKTDIYIQFEFNGSIVTYFPYSGWATGKTIQDGRGMQNLLRQIK